MIRLVALCLLSLVPRATLAAEDVSHFTLSNGLEVVVIEDRRAPVVVQMVWYRVGSADEQPGKTGIAHFLEHLMFKGTKTRAPGEFQEIVRANGGVDNAFTSHDFTGYFQRVAADRLELMMEIEADRMANLVLTEEEVLPERGVVREERRNRVEASPGSLFRERFRTVLYTTYPYRNPIVGWPQDIDGLTREDALAFYAAHYGPDNAILIVAGDTSAEEVRALAEKYYGPIPAAGIPPRSRPAELPAMVERRLSYSDPRVGQPSLTRAYLAPPRRSGDQAEAAALTILAEVLGGGITSHLAQSLEIESRTAVGVGAWFGGAGLGPQQFAISLTPAPGVTLEAAEAALDAALRRFLEEGPDEARLERLKTQIRASEIFARDQIFSRAQSYGSALAMGLTVDDVQAWPDALRAVTVEDIMAAARRVLVPENSVTGYLSPAAEVEEQG